MSREANRRNKKGSASGHVSGRYGTNSPNMYRHNNHGSESSNWRDPPLPSDSRLQKPLTATQQSYGEFLMKGWNEFEEEKKSAGVKVKIIREEKVSLDKTTIDLEQLIKNLIRTTST